MLLENDQRELSSFSLEDQERLIEIAAEEWGCIEEYDELFDLRSPEKRFYQAVKEKEKTFNRQLSQVIEKISHPIIDPQIVSMDWLDLYLENYHQLRKIIQ